MNFILIVSTLLFCLSCAPAQTVPQSPLIEQMSDLSASEPKKIVIIGMDYCHSHGLVLRTPKQEAVSSAVRPHIS